MASGLFVNEFQMLRGIVDAAISRLFSRNEVTDIDGGMVTIRIDDGRGHTTRHDEIPRLRLRPPVTGDRGVVLNAPSLGGAVFLGVIGGEEDEVLLSEIVARLDDLESRVTALEP